jgi:hypothetical protein
MKLRNSSIQFKFAPALLIILTLGSFAICQSVQGVVPPPDGGYPNFNTAEGTNALKNLTTGVGNAAVGWYSLFSNTDGSFNTALGAGSLLSNVGNTAAREGTQNTAIGAAALLSNVTGFDNTAVGAGALSNNTGTENTAVGAGALRNNTTGAVNIALGRIAGLGVTTASNVISIGSLGGNVNDSTWIGNIYGTTTQSQTLLPVVVSDGGQLGTVASSERFKKDILTMEQASEAILSLRPVTFHYKSDARETPQFGLIAEEVGKVNPALVLPDKDGKPYTVRYDAVNAMLLNEFLKEHKQVQEQQATISQLQLTVAKQLANAARQQTQIDALASGLQKVSAEVQMAKPAPQVALNNP